jgi:outer membrane receptor for ferrienterochelin and colicins
LQFRAAYSKGYRAPQIFDEDLHIEASGSRRIIHLNAPGLQQESSNSFTSSLRYTKEYGMVITELLAEGFYTRLQDPFAHEFVFIDSTKTFLQIRKNAEDGAYVAGLNLEFNAAFPKDITLQAGFTLQTSQYDSPQSWGEDESSTSTHFMRTPNQYGYLTLDWHVSKRFSTSFTVNYTGSMYVPHYGLNPITDEEWDYIQDEEWDNIDPSRQKELEAILAGDVIEGEQLEKSEQFLIFGLRLAYDLPISSDGTLQFYTGVQNLFNQTQARHDSGVYRDAGYIYGPCQPRTINFGVKFGNIFH